MGENLQDHPSRADMSWIVGWFVAAGLYLILVRGGSDRLGAASASPSAEAATAV